MMSYCFVHLIITIEGIDVRMQMSTDLDEAWHEVKCLK